MIEYLPYRQYLKYLATDDPASQLRYDGMYTSILLPTLRFGLPSYGQFVAFDHVSQLEARRPVGPVAAWVVYNAEKLELVLWAAPPLSPSFGDIVPFIPSKIDKPIAEVFEAQEELEVFIEKVAPSVFNGVSIPHHTASEIRRLLTSAFSPEDIGAFHVLAPDFFAAISEVP